MSARESFYRKDIFQRKLEISESSIHADTSEQKVDISLVVDSKLPKRTEYYDKVFHLRKRFSQLDSGKTGRLCLPSIMGLLAEEEEELEESQVLEAVLKYKLPHSLSFYDLLTVLYELELGREEQLPADSPPAEEPPVPSQPKQFVLRHRVFEVEKKKPARKKLKVLHGLNYRGIEFIRVL